MAFTADILTICCWEGTVRESEGIGRDVGWRASGIGSGDGTATKVKGPTTWNDALGKMNTASPKMEAVKAQIRRDLDSVATFMAETGYKPSPNKRTLLKTLREEYNEFCKLNNCRQVGHKMFSQHVRSAGFDVVSDTGNRTYVCCETTQNLDLDFVGDVFKLKSSER